MKRSKVVLAAVLAVAVAASFTLSACGGGGGGSAAPASPTPKVQLSGTVSGSYNYAKPSLSKTLYAAGPLVDKVVAIPMTRGSLEARNMTSRVTATIGASGNFDLALPKDQDWLLVLIKAPNTFISSLAVSAGTSSILNLPATSSTLASLNLGTITGTGNNAITSAATVTASNFGMSPSQFTAFANSNDVFKNAKNIINNYNTTSGVWYQLRPDFTWHGDYAAINGVFSGPSWTFNSYNFQMDTNATNLSIQNLCTNGTATFVSVGWTPPSGANITLVGAPTITYNTGNPIMNSAATCTTYMSDGVLAIQASSTDYTHPFYATDAYWGPYGTISYSMPAWFAGTIPPGNWTWTEGGAVKATFDPSVSTPVHTDGIRSLGYVPSIKLTVTGNAVGGVITAVDVEWHYFNGSTYQPVTTAADLAVMSHVMEAYEIIIESGWDTIPRRHSSFRLDPTIPSELHLALPASGPDSWTYANDALSFNTDPFLATDAGSIGVFYSSGGVGRYFFNFARL